MPPHIPEVDLPLNNDCENWIAPCACHVAGGGGFLKIGSEVHKKHNRKQPHGPLNAKLFRTIPWDGHPNPERVSIGGKTNAIRSAPQKYQNKAKGALNVLSNCAKIYSFNRIWPPGQCSARQPSVRYPPLGGLLRRHNAWPWARLGRHTQALGISQPKKKEKNKTPQTGLRTQREQQSFDDRKREKPTIVWLWFIHHACAQQKMRKGVV